MEDDKIKMNDKSEDFKRLFDLISKEYKDELDYNFKLIGEAQNNLKKLYDYQYDNLKRSCKKELENLRSISIKFDEVPFKYEIDKNVEFHKRNTIMDQFNVCQNLNDGSISSIINNFEDEFQSFNISNINVISRCMKYEFNDFEKKKCIYEGLSLNFIILKNEIKIFYNDIQKSNLIKI